MDKVKIGFPIEYEDENNIARKGLFLREPEIKGLEKRLKEINKIIDLKQQCKKQKEVINKAMSILKDNFVYDYVRSCDTTDGVGYDEIDTEHFTYRVYELLKEVSE